MCECQQKITIYCVLFYVFISVHIIGAMGVLAFYEAVCYFLPAKIQLKSEKKYIPKAQHFVIQIAVSTVYRHI